VERIDMPLSASANIHLKVIFVLQCFQTPFPLESHPFFLEFDLSQIAIIYNSGTPELSL